MNGEIFRLLERKEAEQIVRELGRRTFVDGKVSAAGLAAGVKYNLQAEETGNGTNELDDLVRSAIQRHREFQLFAWPKRFVPPIYSRYEPGMKYGDHVDSALMAGPSAIRTDLAATIFLSPPDSYDGGELVIAGGEEIKLDCGEAFVYPATSIHHVTPVTRGIRLAAVTWIQSLVRDESMRGILFDLGRAVQQAEEVKNFDLSLLLSKTFQNLIRYAAEP
jgi:PKHD-type hydroxylase